MMVYQFLKIESKQHTSKKSKREQHIHPTNPLERATGI